MSYSTHNRWFQRGVLPRQSIALVPTTTFKTTTVKTTYKQETNRPLCTEVYTLSRRCTIMDVVTNSKAFHSITPAVSVLQLCDMHKSRMRILQILKLLENREFLRISKVGF